MVSECGGFGAALPDQLDQLGVLLASFCLCLWCRGVVCVCVEGCVC